MEAFKQIILANLVEQIAQLDKQGLQEQISDEPRQEVVQEVTAMVKALNWCISLVKDAYKLATKQNNTEAAPAAVEGVTDAAPVAEVVDTPTESEKTE